MFVPFPDNRAGYPVRQHPVMQMRGAAREAGRGQQHKWCGRQHWQEDAGHCQQQSRQAQPEKKGPHQA